MNKAVLDTDILSAIMRKDADALTNARQYLTAHPNLTISIITRYEILRGLMAKNATTQIANFHRLCGTLIVLPLNDATVVRAASIYGQLRREGKTTGDADILIAATALENGYEIVTNNTPHFSPVQGLVVRNWLAK